MIILDTDIISILDLGEGEAYERLLGKLNDPGHSHVCVTIVSFEEQVRGWLSYIAASRTTSRQVEGYSRLHRMLNWYKQQEVLDFDTAAGKRADALRRSRLRIGTMDLRIGAIALEHNALLVSRNVRDFSQIPDPRVEDWTRLD